MLAAWPIRTDLSAGELRALARRQKEPRAAARMQAIVQALEGKSRADAARLADLERQALHEAAVRHDSEGLAGLHDRPKGHARPVLSAKLKRFALAGPDLARPGRTEWTRPSLAQEVARLLGKRLPGQPVAGAEAAGALGTTRPRGPQANAKAQEAFRKGGLAEAMAAA
ncbi:hypothetical protein [Rubellimicrobium aerolatum]|uniref:Uncharacterized protein n=1 Tax=Rubellimicrobium aerolatum TaxID=490979 RepID=A0ABW0SHK6_9RHOB|nr:hypothetical protein [Rubellimicrobium aerolatum]MBP1807755.1 hypothetical protein [Rubellimicrobium aerolatum]